MKVRRARSLAVCQFVKLAADRKAHRMGLGFLTNCGNYEETNVVLQV